MAVTNGYFVVDRWCVSPMRDIDLCLVVTAPCPAHLPCEKCEIACDGIYQSSRMQMKCGKGGQICSPNDPTFKGAISVSMTARSFKKPISSILRSCVHHRSCGRVCCGNMNAEQWGVKCAR